MSAVAAREAGPRSDIVGAVAAAWACAPDRVADGTRASGLRLSILQNADPAAQEASAAADEDHHTLCFPLSRYSSEVVLDGRRSDARPIGPGQLCLVEAGRQPWGVNHGPWRSLHVYIPRLLVAGIAKADAGPGRGASPPAELAVPVVFRHPGVERICLALAEEVEAPRPYGGLRIDALAQDLVIQLLRDFPPGPDGRGGAAPASARAARGGLAPWQVRRACEVLEARLDGRVGLDELAAAAGCSAPHFSRAFRRSTGLAPFDWLRRRRMERAEALLADPRMPLAAVALAVGFSDQPHFTGAFRRATGFTPGAWRRERAR